MNPFASLKMKKIFKFKGETNILNTRESNTVEFKKSFNWGSKSKYAKTMCAYANREGGYIIFGIKDRPHELIGLNSDKFETIDEEKITSFLNEIFEPEINWIKEVVDVKGKKVGVLYVYESKRKPVISKKNSDKEIKEAEIYYRYRGRSEKIKYPELRALIEVEKDKEKKLWLSHLERISKAGASNISLLDTSKGTIEGEGGTIFIDKGTLKDLEFIKEGEFNEKKGAKTLKLIGEVKEVFGTSVLPIRYKTMAKGINTYEIFEAVLKGKLHEGTEARVYLERLPHGHQCLCPFTYLRN